jgi:hypothetical protein
MPNIANLRLRGFSMGEESLICRRMGDNLKFSKIINIFVLELNHPEPQQKEYQPEFTHL